MTGSAEPTIEDLLRASGVRDDEIEEAKTEGRFELLAIERLTLPDPGRFDLLQLSEATGMPAGQIAQLWRSLGFPDPRPGERIFNQTDVDLLALVSSVLDAGVIEPALTLQMSRVMGSSLARIAQALVEAIETTGAEGGAGGDESAFAGRTAGLLPALPRVMDAVWRRHLQAAARSRLARREADGTPDHKAVGFADLVGFTALSQQLSTHELAVVVDRFESIAYDTVVLLRGRVVKMIGDEAMFTVDDERSAVEIGLTLAETYGADEELSEVRVGIASGPVLEREADCYGPVVNLANRIVGIALPGAVVVSEEVHDALADEDGFRWRSLRPRRLKDIGRVPLWRVRRAAD